MAREYYVYILANKHNTVLYTGVTNDLRRRVYQHKSKAGGGFTGKYNIDKLVFYEVLSDPYSAITREKQFKGGSRRARIELIEKDNPAWHDLYDDL